MLGRSHFVKPRRFRREVRNMSYLHGSSVEVGIEYKLTAHFAVNLGAATVSSTTGSTRPWHKRAFLRVYCSRVNRFSFYAEQLTV